MILHELFDEKTFTELSKYPQSSVITGFGCVAGSNVYAFITDINVKSGAIGTDAAAKLKKLYVNAVKFGAPVVAVFNSKGGEIAEGIDLITAYADIITNAVKLSGVVPLVSIVTGQCSGLLAALCCMSDVVIMTEEAELYFTPPFLTGGKLHGAGSAQLCAESGIAHIAVKDELEAMLKTRQILSLLPLNNLESPCCGDFEPNDAAITPALCGMELIRSISDKGSVLEFSAGYGAGVVTAFGVLDGFAVGFAALDNGAVITAGGANKLARFVNLCDAFSLPVVTIIKNDGFERRSGADLIRATARLAQVYASATTPKVTIVTGYAAGDAFIITGAMSADYVLAYEGAALAPLAVRTAAAFLEIPEHEYIEKHASVKTALQKGLIDEVIAPSETRSALITALGAVRDKRINTPARKHINLMF